jgi:hypothetical protein
VKGLILKGWIRVEPDGNFELEGAGEQVTDPITGYESGNPQVTDTVTRNEGEVTKIVTKVTESVTDSYQNGNPLIKDLKHRSEHTNNTRRERPPTAADFAPPIGPTMKANHPALIAVRALTGHQPDRATWDGIIEILGVDPDLGKLNACYREWVMRGYKKTNYGWIADWYKMGIQEGRNGSSKNNARKSNADVFEEAGEFYANWPGSDKP